MGSRSSAIPVLFSFYFFTAEATAPDQRLLALAGRRPWPANTGREVNNIDIYTNTLDSTRAKLLRLIDAKEKGMSEVLTSGAYRWMITPSCLAQVKSRSCARWRRRCAGGASRCQFDGRWRRCSGNPHSPGALAEEWTEHQMGSHERRRDFLR